MIVAVLVILLLFWAAALTGQLIKLPFQIGGIFFKEPVGCLVIIGLFALIAG